MDNTTNDIFSNSLNSLDVGFIRKNNRFKVDRKFIIEKCIVLNAVPVLGIVTFYYKYTSPQHTGSLIFNIILCFSPVLLSTFFAYRLAQNIFFKTISNTLTENENRELILSYLKNEHILYYEDGNLIAIFSTQLYNNNDNCRECVIFIPDNNKILINNVFIKNDAIKIGHPMPYRSFYKKLLSDVASLTGGEK